MASKKSRYAYEIEALISVYDVTDCSNRVYDWAMLRGKRTLEACEHLVARGLLVGECVDMVDGDGCLMVPERSGPGYQLTLKGYEALTAFDANSWPPELRREWAKKPAEEREARD